MSTLKETLAKKIEEVLKPILAQKKAILEGKGVINNQISGFIMQNLNAIGVPTHYIKTMNMREQLVREEYPLARKAIRNILKDKDNNVPPNSKVAAAKLIYDKVHADRMEQPGSPVNIENIERLQVLIQSDVSHITGNNE